jgi:2-C-methyl-D-erythritol 4-phosphate cytidylyltransferase / 2-C-methyl-D-erythritol 2,4-cyclodiphosphate synthase
MPKTVAVLLAAGQGRRAGELKQFRRVAGRTLLEHAAFSLTAVREISGLIVVVPESDVERVARGLDRIGLPRWRRVVAGGATRHLSSRCGLGAVPEECERLLVHDAARPFASPTLIRRLLRALRNPEVAGVIPAVAVHDSTIQVSVPSSDGGTSSASRVTALRYLDRPSLRAVQTPQAFRADALRDAFARARGRDYCDDAIVVRGRGLRVDVVAGEAENRKITTAEELRAALRELRAGEKAR